MDDPQEPPEAAWYPDPSDPALARYWDGTAWTSHTTGIDDLTPPADRPRDGLAWWQVLLIVLGIVFGLLLLLFGICVAVFTMGGF